jgi:hypothetical protein
LTFSQPNIPSSQGYTDDAIRQVKPGPYLFVSKPTSAPKTSSLEKPDQSLISKRNNSRANKHGINTAAYWDEEYVPPSDEECSDSAQSRSDEGGEHPDDDGKGPEDDEDNQGAFININGKSTKVEEWLASLSPHIVSSHFEHSLTSSLTDVTDRLE